MASSELRERRRAGYESERSDVLALVPAYARRVLDLGCASGALGAAIKRRQDARVVGVELVGDYARAARAVLDEVIEGDVASALAQLGGGYDCLVAADVLEHLADPWAALRAAAGLVTPGGTVVVSLPNARSFELFLELGLRGRWPRRDEGLFDSTHLRWFALADARELVEGAGLVIERVQPSLFYGGWQLRVARVLARTPLAPFVTGQYLLLARRPG